MPSTRSQTETDVDSPESAARAGRLLGASQAHPHRLSGLLLPSVADVLFITLLLALSCGALGRLLLRDADTGWHIRNGELILQTHTITRTDPFSSTMGGQPWYAWEWLYDVIIAAIHRTMGLNGVVFLTAALIAATFVLVFHLAMRRGGTLVVSVMLVLLALVASTIHCLARPHVASWLFVVIWFELLDSGRSDKNTLRIFWLPLLMIVWVNLHGGFLLGLGLLGVYLVAAALEYFAVIGTRVETVPWLRRLGIVILLSFAASLINPFGYRLYGHVYQYLSNSFLINRISEFMSPSFHGGAGIGFIALLLISMLALATSRQSISLAQWLVVLYAIYSGLYSARNLPISAILLVLVISPLCSEVIATASKDIKLAAWLRSILLRLHSFGIRMGHMELQSRSHLWLILAFVLGLVTCMNGGRLGSVQLFHAYFESKRFPVEAAEVIAERDLHEPVFCPDSWGGYLIYRLYPQIKVVVDDRHDLYGEQFFKDYLQVMQVEPEWEDVLDRMHVNWVIAPSNSALVTVMKLTPQWKVIHQDTTAVLFQRAGNT